VNGLARRIAVAAALVLGLQFVGALAIQALLSLTLREEIVHQVLRGMEQSGGLRACVERPGPWEDEDDWWRVWPIDEDGLVIGEAPPVVRVELAAAGSLTPLTVGDRRAGVYATSAPGCGGILVVERTVFPILEADSSKFALLATSRVVLALFAGVALMLVTAVPLVRRIRALSHAMEAVVESDFQGTVSDGADDELGEVAAAFDAAAATARERLERLEHRDALLRRALADLAHDLRTPLATLKLSTSSLPASSSTSAIRSELDFLEGMARNFEALLGGDDEGEATSVSLEEVVTRVEHRFAPLARDRGLAFDTALPDAPLHAVAEPVALERALSNLVQNALRFARGHVVVLLFADGDEVRLEVRDDGPGLGEISGRAAERGVRGDGTAEQGFGLGLAIADAAARRFGGRLELFDGDEGGAVVAIVVPRLAG